MKFFIDKIFNGACDELVHQQFKKFSRGEFKNRAVAIVKNSGGKFLISTTPEYGNEFVRFLAERLGSNSTHITGVIVSTRDLNEELDFQNKKQFMGVKQYVIDKEMSGSEILNLCERFPGAFFGLSFSTSDSELKIKPKAPKSAKPSTKEEADLKVNFCKLKTSNKEIVKGIVFDEELNFKQMNIYHDFIIDQIVVDENLKKEAGNDFAIIKDKSLRKGKILRRMNIDGREISKEIEFEG